MAYKRGYRQRPYRRRKGFFERMSLTNLIILINVIAFVILFPLLTSGLGETVIKYVALSPELFIQGFVWTLLTSMFMHGGFGHLFVNMISMFFIGNFVERLVGKRRFLWFYLISGLVAGLAFVGLAYLGLFIPNGQNIFGGIDAFAVGASGALFGLGGLLAVLIPRLKVLVMFVIPMPMWLAMVVLMFGLWIVSASAGWPIGNTAHFGGLVVGVVYGVYLRKRYAKKVRMLNKMFG